MKKLVFVLVALTFSCAPVLAEPWADAPGTGAYGGHDSDNSHGNADYHKLDTPGEHGGHRNLGTYNEGARTNSQGAGAPNGPDLEGAPGSAGHLPHNSGAAMGSVSATVKYFSPSNLALQVERAGVFLPPTRLTSIVADCGYAEDIFGDESTQGPPPLGNYRLPGSGIQATTGHPSDAEPVSAF